MNEKTLIKKISNLTDINEDEVKNVLDQLCKIIKMEIISNRTVEINIGEFKPKTLPGRKVIDKNTGNEIYMDDFKLMHFSMSDEIKKSLNN